MDKKSNAGEGIVVGNASWTFGTDTPKYFNEHVKRSIPFYERGHELILEVSDFFMKPGSVCYELGVSTGALLHKLASRHQNAVKCIGIDVEPDMIGRARSEIEKKLEKPENLELVTDDICFFDYEPSDFIMSYYTIQFIHPKLRQDLINKIYQSLHWGGAFVLFEKVRGSDARFQDIFTSLYTDFKLKQGYRSDEIIAKSRSLKGVLEPFSTQGNIDLLKRAGFVDIITIFKYICFEGFLCIK